VKVSIIGLGYVGLPIAVHAAEAGYTVGGFDIDSNKINQLESGISDSPEVSPDQILSLKAQGKLFFSSKDTFSFNLFQYLKADYKKLQIIYANIRV
jgi:UDP-N-acetyl-D-mannosaminuronate dehydrogenase